MYKKPDTRPFAPVRALSLPAALILGLALAGCATPPPPPEAEIRTEVLHMFVRFDDGSHGYDFNRPVPYHPFTDEVVRIPSAFTPVKRQFRGAWVATVHNLNFPLTASPEAFREEFTKILDTLEDLNMNALIFQVRPLLDAFYPSRINPWSQFLTGRQGADPGWDPLEWMVAETHLRGMEFHAWLNPFRVTASRWLAVPGRTAAELEALGVPDAIRTLNAAGILADGNFAVLNPEYVYRFNGRLYLDAGFPQVREHVIETVRELIENYDVCAVHFDDYFYPYRAGALVFGAAGEDRRTFELHGLGRFPDTPGGVEAWRRDNNTALVRGVGAAVAAENERSGRAIQFGISPFGIWEHRQNHPLGSNTPPGSGRTFSDSVFADTLLWVREGLIDYIIPQIYWSFDQRAAPYGELVRWWASAVEGSGVSLYIGHANYKHLNNAAFEVAWMNPEEILNQMRYNQLHPQVTGSAFFSFASLLPVAETEPRHAAANEANRLLREHLRSHKTIVPVKQRLSVAPPSPPLNVVRRGDTVTWTAPDDGTARYFVVYRAPRARLRREGLAAVIEDPRNIVARVRQDGPAHSFTDRAPPERPERYVYIVTAFNAAHVESEPVPAGRR